MAGGVAVFSALGYSPPQGWWAFIFLHLFNWGSSSALSFCSFPSVVGTLFCFHSLLSAAKFSHVFFVWACLNGDFFFTVFIIHNLVGTFWIGDGGVFELGLPIALFLYSFLSSYFSKHKSGLKEETRRYLTNPIMLFEFSPKLIIEKMYHLSLPLAVLALVKSLMLSLTEAGTCGITHPWRMSSNSVSA